MIDLARVRQKAADIRGAVATLRALAARSEQDFIADDLAVSAAKYKLLVAMEAALDLCNHVCAKRLAKAPGSYADCFRLLADGGVLSEETARQMIPMARFRNLLVHQYGQVDDRRLHSILLTTLDDFNRYLEEVSRYLGQDV